MAVTAPLEAPAASLGPRPRAGQPARPWRPSPRSRSPRSSTSGRCSRASASATGPSPSCCPSRLGILHPTGYPLYSLLGKLFSLIPFESLAWRANVLSAIAAAGDRRRRRPDRGPARRPTGRRDGRRPEPGLHRDPLGGGDLLRDEQRSTSCSSRSSSIARWSGATSDGPRPGHRGAAGRPVRLRTTAWPISVVPIVILFVLVDARREIAVAPARPASRRSGPCVVGLLPYLYLPLRALAGPADVYGPFLTWKGFFDLRQRRPCSASDMHFTSIDSAQAALGRAPAGLRSPRHAVERASSWPPASSGWS